MTTTTAESVTGQGVPEGAPAGSRKQDREGRPLRIWPAAVMVALYWIVLVACTQTELVTFFRFAARVGSAALLGLAVCVWWWTRRQVRLRHRSIAFAGFLAGWAVVNFVADPSYRGVVLLMAGVPVVCTAGVLWLMVGRKASPRTRLAGLTVAMSLAWAFFATIRLDGIDGEQNAAVHWRWEPTAEQRFLAERASRPKSAAPSAPAADFVLNDWPGFRGPERDGVVRDLTIPTDWAKNPPKQLWKVRVGPAWSSVAAAGGRIFTQEQRGDKEAVVCYDAATGTELWAHEDDARFWEAVAGAGPRATPEIAGGRVYAYGATGLLNALDAATGERLWQRNVAEDASAKPPSWGFSSSPLVTAGLVVVHAGGSKGLLAYRAADGGLAWTAPAGEVSYTSPQLITIDGQPQILFVGDQGLTSVNPADGAVLWTHDAPMPGAPRNLQPHLLPSGEVLINSEVDLPVAAITVSHDGGKWAAKQEWTTNQFKPSFNDYVVRDGRLYGFDGAIFACLELASKKRLWKAGRYGHGQVVLLDEQGLLLVVTETGEVVLVAADPERHRELGRFRAVEGKTWNHPAVVGRLLVVRNAEEMACFDLGTAK